MNVNKTEYITRICPVNGIFPNKCKDGETVNSYRLDFYFVPSIHFSAKDFSLPVENYCDIRKTYIDSIKMLQKMFPHVEQPALVDIVEVVTIWRKEG